MLIVYKKNSELYKTELSNDDLVITDSNDGNHVVVDIVALNDIELVSASIKSHLKIDKKTRYFLNGYQSWTDSNELTLSCKEKNVLKLPSFLNKTFAFHKYGDATFYSYSKATLHGYDYFYAKGSGEFDYFSYSLNYKNAFLVYELNKAKKVLNFTSMVEGIVLSKNEKFRVFDFKYFSNYIDGLNSFNLDFPKLNKEKILGYTSWYNYYQNINEKVILNDLVGLDERFNLFQIDDGYETFVGDWMDIDVNKFSNGFKEITSRIHKSGRKVGIWLAPLVAEEKSLIFKTHPELFRKDEDGNPIKCGSNWSGFYALDLENEEAWKYIEKCLDFFIKLGFDFFKLDFLYAASLPLYKGKSRAMMAYNAYSRLRKILKGKIILGCGATISSSYGNFDYLRVGPDVSLKFDDVFYMHFMHRERISTKVTLQNTISRYFMNDRLFGNDPDVFILRDENISLTPEQKYSLMMINSLFSNILMTSDNIKNYNDIQKGLLDQALDIYYNASDKSFSKNGNRFTISYSLNNEKKTFTYNAKTGVSTNG